MTNHIFQSKHNGLKHSLVRLQLIIIVEISRLTFNQSSLTSELLIQYSVRLGRSIEVSIGSVHKGGAQNVTFHYTSVVVLKL